MSNSKLSVFDPLLGLGAAYNRAIRRNPLLVKSFTSCVLGALGNYLSQVASRPSAAHGAHFIKKRSVAAFALLGLGLFGPVVHFWLNFLERHGPSHPALKLALDRFGFSPVMLLITLYLLPILEGSSHPEAVAQVKRSYWSALKMNWKVWIIAMGVILNFVPLQYRVLCTNLVSVGWNIYLSKARAKMAEAEIQKKKLKADKEEESSEDQ